MDRSSDLSLSDIRESLQRNIDMSEYQSQVYLALIQNGKQTMKEVADASDVPKQRVYDIVEELRDRGFVELNDSYPKRAYAIDPSKTLAPIQQQIEDIQNDLKERHRSVSDVDSGVAQFRSRTTINKYVSELLTSAERTVFLLTSLDRLQTFEDELRSLDDVQVRIVLTGLDETDIQDGAVSLNSPVQEFADHVRGTVQTEPFVLSVDRSNGFFWPNVRERTQEGFYVTDEELAFLFDQFLSDSVWPRSYPFETSSDQSSPQLPVQYFRIEDCLDDLSRLTEQLPIDALMVEFDAIDRVSGTQVTREGTLTGFYHSEFDDSAYLEVDLGEVDSISGQTVTVGGWTSTREDFRAERIQLRERDDWSRGAFDTETLSHLENCQQQLPDELAQRSVFVGFDGYIDHIRHLVGERKSPRMYDEISEFDTLRQMMTRATGKERTLQFEWVEGDRLPGGHTAHVGSALDTLGYESQLVGYFGHPIEEEFQERFREESMLSLGEPTVTEYVQFSDGKLLFTDSNTHQALNWETLREYIPPEELARYLDESDLVSIGGWSLITEIPTIWEGLHEQIVPRVSSLPEDILVCATDVSHLNDTTIRSDLESLDALDRSIPVTLVTTGEQAEFLADVLLPEDRSEQTLANTTQELRKTIGISRFAVASKKESVLATSSNVFRMQAIEILDPAEEGTFEDHFSAGLAVGLTQGLDDEAAFALANVLAAYFKQHQRPPEIDELHTSIDEYIESGE